MVPETLIIKIIFLLQAVGVHLLWLYWIQTKEYRFDRFFVFLKTQDGMRELLVIHTLIKFLVIMVGFFLNPFLFLYLVEIFFLLIYFLTLFIKRRLRKPVFTKRLVRISLISCLCTFITLFVLKTDFWIGLFYSELSLIIGPVVGVFLTGLSVKKTLETEKKEARRILSSVKPIVIGITGSYGKTTTKDFVAHLLSQKYKTAKTEGSENTEFGIARKTFKNVKSYTKFFIVEMGAYKIGEINKLAAIVSPVIGVITGIEEQHLSLFGSLENIKKAKFELIESLPKGGTAIFNLSNKYTQELMEKAKKLNKELKTYGYYMLKDKDTVKTADFRSKVVSADVGGITFEVTDGKERRKFTTSLHGVHFIENLTGAILIARIMGVSWREIEKGVATLTNTEHTMNVFELANGNIVVDDSYNSTPKGFEAALTYLNLFKDKKKVVVTPGIIELGNLSDKVHKELGDLMTGVVDKVFVLSNEAHRVIRDTANQKTSINLVNEPEDLIQELEKINESVILLEGRQPAKLIKYLEEKRR